MVAVGVAWIPIVQNFAELFHYIQSVTSFLSPPICAVYVLGVMWQRVNEVVRYCVALFLLWEALISRSESAFAM